MGAPPFHGSNMFHHLGLQISFNLSQELLELGFQPPTEESKKFLDGFAVNKHMCETNTCVGSFNINVPKNLQTVQKSVTFGLFPKVREKKHMF